MTRENSVKDETSAPDTIRYQKGDTLGYPLTPLTLTHKLRSELSNIIPRETLGETHVTELSENCITVTQRVDVDTDLRSSNLDNPLKRVWELMHSAETDSATELSGDGIYLWSDYTICPDCGLIGEDTDTDRCDKCGVEVDTPSTPAEVTVDYKLAFPSQLTPVETPSQLESALQAVFDEPGLSLR